jgi:hypothetical protein
VTAPTRALATQRCNIGPAEIERRRRIAIALTVVTLGMAAGLLAAAVPPVARGVLWPFAAATAVTWLQVVRRFCVRFGAAGLENLGAPGEERPVDTAIRVADRNRALAMIAEGALIGLVATLAVVALPV